MVRHDYLLFAITYKTILNNGDDVLSNFCVNCFILYKKHIRSEMWEEMLLSIQFYITEANSTSMPSRCWNFSVDYYTNFKKPNY